MPQKILINKNYIDSNELDHIIQLAHEKNVEIESCQLKNYKCCGIIKKIN